MKQTFNSNIVELTSSLLFSTRKLKPRFQKITMISRLVISLILLNVNGLFLRHLNVIRLLELGFQKIILYRYISMKAMEGILVNLLILKVNTLK